MEDFDYTVSLMINALANRWGWFDALMHGFTNNYLLKSASLITLYYVAWFAPTLDIAVARQRQTHLLAGLGAAVLAPVLARLFAVMLPYRDRPLHTDGFPFKLPEHMKPDVDIGWSSFPSDTAALVVPLAVGLFVADRRLGILASVIVAIDCFARIFSGLHFLTDILAGATLGVTAFCLIACTPLKKIWTRPSFWLLEACPEIFYGAFFLITYQIANVFWESFNIVNHFMKIAILRHG